MLFAELPMLVIELSTFWIQLMIFISLLPGGGRRHRFYSASRAESRQRPVPLECGIRRRRAAADAP
jgi:hypothetical protein